MANITHLPKTATDGLEVCDAYGTIWKYDLQINSWINIGTIGDSLVVTESKNGLVSPAIYTRINAISQAVQSGLNFNFLKIYPHIHGYYYLFQSSNHTVTFEPESSNDLRMEISRSRLLSLLSQLKCPGAQGATGDRGDTGIDGEAGTAELRYSAIISNRILSISVPVDNSLGTPISLRIFANNSNIPTTTIKIIGSEFVVLQSAIEIDLDYTFFDYSDGQLVGQITSPNWGAINWYYKALQMGRKGVVGADGSGFLNITSDAIDDADLRSNTAIILIREGDGADVINYLSAELYKTNCVSKVSVNHLCSTTTISLTDSYAALQMSADKCKNIARFIMEPIVADMPGLVFSEWTPTGTCLRQRHLAATKLSWMDFTRVGSDMKPWHKANEDIAGDPGYPWSIVEDSDPGQLCCQEDFFFCSNVNDVTGACPVALVDDIQAPPSSAYGCDCDCPISFLLEGGYEFEDVKITSVDDVSSQVAVCSVNGEVHEYNLTVNVSTTTAVITVSWKLEYDSLCDEAREIYAAQISDIPDFVFDPRDAVSEENCPISWTITDKTTQTTTISRTDSSPQASSTIGVMSFNFTGTSGTIITTAAINILRLNCCLGYKLTVSVSAVEAIT
jgi:hypothetical protein